MSNVISDAVRKLSAISKKNPIDWNAFDETLNSLADINVFDEEYEETILSEYITDGDFYKRGDVLPLAIRHFLANGYDVHANEGRNGSLALSALCWSSYDRNILEAAKLLMNSGAPTICCSADDEPDEEPRGVLGDIAWKVSGAWVVDKDYSWANILEAYYALAEANANKKDFNSISCYADCLGLEVTSVSSDIADKEALLTGGNSVQKFSKPLIIWFGHNPLVVSPYIDLIVNPIHVEDNKRSLVDASSAFSVLIGSKLIDIHYFASTICRFTFDNGLQLVLASRDIGNRKRIGTFEIRPCQEDTPIESLRVDHICGAKGFTYGSTVTNYDETVLAFFCGKDAYLLHPVSGENSKHQMKLFHCSKDILTEYTRQYPVCTPEKISGFYEDGCLTGIRFDYDDEFLYFKTTEYYEIEVILSDYQFDPLKCCSLHSKPGRHIDFKKRDLEFYE